jgi:hypothetical protein
VEQVEQRPAATPAQIESHSTEQQKPSAAQTAVQQSKSLQPGPTPATQQSFAELVQGSPAKLAVVDASIEAVATVATKDQ